MTYFDGAYMIDLLECDAVTLEVGIAEVVRDRVEVKAAV